MKTVLNQINIGFKANNYGVEYECECTGRKADAEAYVSPYSLFDDDIHFCPIFSESDADRQAEVVLHEASHLFAFTSDFKLKGGSPWERNPNDAYSIQMFIMGPAKVYKLVTHSMMLAGTVSTPEE